MRLLHDPLKISASFDDPDLVSRAGLVPVMALAERAGLHGLTRRHVRIAGRAGAYPEVKVACLVAGMAAGADSTGDMDLLAFAGIDSMQRRACGYKKQGAAFGHTKISGKTVLVRGLNALAATISTPQAGPVIAGTRLRGGSANTARGAASFTAEALGTARGAGCAGMIVARADSGLYCAAFTGACRRAGAHFSVTARMDPAVKAAIASIPHDAWTPIRYPRAIWDDQLRAWVPAPRSPRSATPRSPRRRARPSPPG